MACLRKYKILGLTWKFCQYVSSTDPPFQALLEKPATTFSSSFDSHHYILSHVTLANFYLTHKTSVIIPSVIFLKYFYLKIY